MSMTQIAVPVNAARMAKQGDARALLAIPEAREDIPRLISGGKADRASLTEPYGFGDNAVDPGDYQIRRHRYVARWGWTFDQTPLATDFAGRKTIAVAKQIVSDRVARRAARKAAEAARQGEAGRTLRRIAEREAARLEALRLRTESAVHEAFRGLYRVYKSDTTVRFGEPAVSVQTTTKWVSGRGGHGHVTDGQTTHFTLPESWLADVNERDLDYADGLLTLSAERVDGMPEGIEVYRASWVRQGQGYKLYRESGCLARHRASGTTYHSPHADPKKAVSGLRRKMTAQSIPADVRSERARANAAKRAARQAVGIARLVERIARWDFAEIGEVVVHRAHSLKAGNCAPGTDDFISRYFPEREMDTDPSATIGEIAVRVGRLDPARLSAADLKFARELAAACLVAIRADRNARRLVMA